MNLNKMSKLCFKYGAMNSSKTANLLMTAHNYLSKNKKVFLIKPNIDKRFGKDTVNSRAVDSMKADLLMEPSEHSIEKYVNDDIKCVLVDEAQFLSSKNIEALREISVRVKVICYGLRTDYKSKLFEGSRRLFELADDIEEIKTSCMFCDNDAVINCKFKVVNNKKIIITTGSSDPDLGAEDKYQPMCWDCWNKNMRYHVRNNDVSHQGRSIVIDKN
jgi:thymidine kinase